MVRRTILAVIAICSRSDVSSAVLAEEGSPASTKWVRYRYKAQYSLCQTNLVHPNPKGIGTIMVLLYTNSQSTSSQKDAECNATP